MKFAFIQAHAHEHTVTRLCRVLQVSKAGYYAWGTRAPSARAVETAALTTAIEGAYRASRGRYGSPRVHDELQAHGRAHSRKRIARIMQQHGWRAVAPKRFRVTTEASGAPVAPNVLARRFTPAHHPTCNRAWVSDITYLTTRDGFLYLAIVIDLASRRVVGWTMQDTLESTLSINALTMALTARQPGPGLVLHSDRGSQYTATEYRALLDTHHIIESMSRRGNCWDNAVAESFFATLKRELLIRVPWRSRDDARADIFEFIEIWYNRQRRHSSLNYRSPVDYERQRDTAA